MFIILVLIELYSCCCLIDFGACWGEHITVGDAFSCYKKLLVNLNIGKRKFYGCHNGDRIIVARKTFDATIFFCAKNAVKITVAFLISDSQRDKQSAGPKLPAPTGAQRAERIQRKRGAPFSPSRTDCSTPLEAPPSFASSSVLATGNTELGTVTQDETIAISGP